MVSKQSVKKQLNKLDFNYRGWGRTEVSELHNILLPGEEIFELVNGFYEGGFALLIATDIRVLLIDKKPMKYLTVEDIRFDMINEMDYSHRLFGANISIATGNKTLKFTSLNQPRLRKLINHVQHCMAELKKQPTANAQDQRTHLEQINQQLQAYLVAQHQHQLKLEEIQKAQQSGVVPPPMPEPVKPSPELSDFLLAQSLLAQYEAQTGQSALAVSAQTQPLQQVQPVSTEPLEKEIYNEGLKEVFGKHQLPSLSSIPNPLDMNAFKIAYSKLPIIIRDRKIGRPSFHPSIDIWAINPARQNMTQQAAEA